MKSVTSCIKGGIPLKDGALGRVALEHPALMKIEFPEGKDMIQAVTEDKLFAIELKEFEMFVHEKGRKPDKHIYRVKAG